MPPSLSAWRRGAGPPLVLGHRGARRRAPENTLAAFELAVREGAAGVELDVRLDADGSVIVLHDRTLARVTGWHDVRDVERVSSPELARIDVGARERAPELRDVLSWAARGGHRVNVELKRDVSSRALLAEGVARQVRALPDPAGTVLLSSFHPGVVRRLASMLPDVPCCWLVHAGQHVLRYAPGWRALGAAGVHPESALARAGRVARWKRAGALVNVWTVNDTDEARRLARAGVDAIITDTPLEVIAALR